MNVLVVNAGSSSLKYQLFDTETNTVFSKGICERIGVTGSITHKAADGRVYTAETPMPTHSEAFEAVVYAMTKSEAKVAARYICANAHQVQPDSQGRVMLQPEMLAFAGITKNIITVGCGKYAEIWSEEVWNEQQLDKEPENFTAMLLELGL